MNTSSNPYIGPRTFKEDERDRFFGRDREANELLARVLSEQETVFYAQSGAGKSSLVNTCLIPELKRRGIEVLQARVGGESRAGLEVDNIFVFNLLRSLSTGEVDETVLARQALDDFLTPEANAQPESEEGSANHRALIIDQFEEIFSTHHEAWDQRAPFFEQLARALAADPRLRVLLVMREDYVASLDPYAYLLQSRFRIRYYMQRLEYASALKAVKEPVKGKEFGRPYEKDAAEKLVDDLRTIKITRPDGTSDLGLGQFVEPLYLQVICYELWNNLPADGTTITMKNVHDIGDVSTSLGNYYARRVASVAEAEKVSEGKIRRWFTEELISSAGIRNMVLEEPGETSAKLENRVIRDLSDLIRAEQRGGSVFYELTHDRLVEPIRSSNKQWFDEHLSPLQKQAALWDSEGRKDSWLLTDEALADVKKWASEHQDEVGENELEFLAASQTFQKQLVAERESQQREQERQQRELELAQKLADAQTKANQRISKQLRTTRIFAGIALVLFAAAIFLGYQSYQNQRISQMQTLIVASSGAAKIGDERLATRLAFQALNTYGSEYGEVEEALGNIKWPVEKKVSNKVPFRIETAVQNTVSYVTLDPDRMILGSGYSDGAIILWDLERHQLISNLPARHYTSISSLSFSSDGKTLASTSQDTFIVLWDISDPANPKELVTLEEHTDIVNALAFSPDGKTLASGSSDSTIILWDVSNQNRPLILSTLTEHSEVVWGIAFNRDGKTLASGSWDDSVIVWDLHDLKKPSVMATLNQHSSDVETVAFSPDGRLLASGSDDNTVILWNLKDFQPYGSPLADHSGWVKYVAFSPSGSRLVSKSDNGEIILWDVNDPAKPIQLTALTGNSNAIFGPSDETLVAGSDGSKIVVRNISDPASLSDVVTLIEGAEDNVVNFMSLVSDGKKLVAIEKNSNITLLDIANNQATGTLALPKNIGEPSCIAFSTDGKYAAAGNSDGTVAVWDPSEDGEITPKLFRSSGKVSEIAFSPGANYVAASYENNIVRVWDVANELEITSIEHPGLLTWVTAVAFSSDGKYVATGTDNGNVFVWDAMSGEKAVHISLNRTALDFLSSISVTAIDFSPDGTRLAIALNDKEGTVEIWDKDLEQLILAISNGQRKTLNPLIGGLFNSSSKDRSEQSVIPENLIPGTLNPSASNQGSIAADVRFSENTITILYQTGVVEQWAIWPSRSQLKDFADSMCGVCELSYAERLNYKVYTVPMQVSNYSWNIILISNLLLYALCIGMIYRTVFTNPADRLITKGIGGNKLILAGAQGVGLILLGLATIIVIQLIDPAFINRAEAMGIVLGGVLLTFPFGLWPGIAYSQWVRLKTGKRARMIHVFLGSLVGAVIGSLAGFIGFTIIIYSWFGESILLAGFLGLFLGMFFGVIVSILSFLGALLHILWLYPWSERRRLRRESEEVPFLSVPAVNSKASDASLSQSY